jgi:hypothetical protein
MRFTQVRAVILLTGFLVFILLALPLQSRQAQQSAPAELVCGTMNTEFTEGRCIQLTFSGEVSAAKNFDRPFGLLRFRLNSQEASSGWWIEVMPAEQTNSGSDEYVWVVTPPYHFGNARYLDTSYGARAEDAVKGPRDFNFALDQQQFHRAAELVNLGVSSHPLSAHKSEAELDKESEDAIAALESLSIGKGRLQILDSRVDGSAGQDGLGAIEWLKFRVELHAQANARDPEPCTTGQT